MEGNPRFHLFSLQPQERKPKHSSHTGEDGWPFGCPPSSPHPLRSNTSYLLDALVLAPPLFPFLAAPSPFAFFYFCPFPTVFLPPSSFFAAASLAYFVALCGFGLWGFSFKLTPSPPPKILFVIATNLCHGFTAHCQVFSCVPLRQASNTHSVTVSSLHRSCSLLATVYPLWAPFQFCWFHVVFRFFLFMFVFRSCVVNLLRTCSPPTVHCQAFSRVPTTMSFQCPFCFQFPACAQSTCAFSVFYLFHCIVAFLQLYLWYHVIFLVLFYYSILLACNKALSSHSNFVAFGFLTLVLTLGCRCDHYPSIWVKEEKFRLRSLSALKVEE